MRVVGELLVARGTFPLLVQRLNGGARRLHLWPRI